MRFVSTGARAVAGGHRKVRPGPPTGYRSVGSHTPDLLCGERGGPPPARVAWPRRGSNVWSSGAAIYSFRL